ncbi:MAG: hypothetical protein K8R69_01545, partial [Deltaproteobacteria bacterium]|nr:hypothetical protein [Deltaproteobacteria bacterium]
MVFSALRVGSRRESASSVEAFRASPALASVLMNLAGASSSLQNDSSDSALLRWSQACGGTTGLTLREAYDRLSASEREALRLGFGPLVEEWMALSQEGDPALFAEGLAGMARRFQQSGDAVRAGILWQFLSQGNGELSPRLGADFRARAAAEAGASRGEGPFGARFENLARTFAQQAADPTMIAGMGAAGIVAGTVRLGVLSRLAASPGANLFTRGMGASFTAATAAWAAEVPTFWATTRALHAVTSSRPLAWDRGTLLREIGSTALLLGLLKLGGAGSGALFNRVHGISTTSLEVTRLTGFTRMTQSVFPQLGMFGGIYADHLIEERLGWRPRSDGASRVFDSLATLFQFHVGGRLAGEALGPRYAETLRGLETRTRLLESPPLVSNVSGFGDFDGLFGQSPAWASVGGGTRPPRGGSGDPLDGISQMSAVKPERQAAVRARRVPDPKPSEERAVEPEVNHAALAQAFHATPAKDLDRFVKMNFERGSLARLALALEAEG